MRLHLNFDDVADLIQGRLRLVQTAAERTGSIRFRHVKVFHDDR
jgi:hypothetical protein